MRHDTVHPEQPDATLQFGVSSGVSSTIQHNVVKYPTKEAFYRARPDHKQGSFALQMG